MVVELVAVAIVKHCVMLFYDVLSYYVMSFSYMCY